MNSFFCNSVWTHKQALFWYLWLWGSALFSGSSPNELCFIYNCALTHQMSSVFCRRPQFLWWVLVAGTVGRVSYNPQCCRCVFLVDLHTSVKKKKFFYKNTCHQQVQNWHELLVWGGQWCRRKPQMVNYLNEMFK